MILCNQLLSFILKKTLIRLLHVAPDPFCLFHSLSTCNFRQKYLDVMRFPTLFPSFGAHHDRSVSIISQSEYAKSLLLNKDSHFRKDAQYVSICTGKRVA